MTRALAEILAQLHTNDGRVAVPGFYDDVLPLSEAERDELSKTAWTEDGWRQVTERFISICANTKIHPQITQKSVQSVDYA